MSHSDARKLQHKHHRTSSIVGCELFDVNVSEIDTIQNFQDDKSIQDEANLIELNQAMATILKKSEIEQKLLIEKNKNIRKQVLQLYVDSKKILKAKPPKEKVFLPILKNKKKVVKPGSHNSSASRSRASSNSMREVKKGYSSSISISVSKKLGKFPLGQKTRSPGSLS